MKRIAIGVAAFLFLCMVLAIASAGNKPKSDTAVQAQPVAATKEPTATSIPPTPKPSATPSYLLQEQSYASAVGNQAKTMKESLQRIGALMQNPQLFNSSWKVSVGTELGIWKLTYQEAKALNPPPRFEKVHEKYLQGMTLYNTAADDVANGIDNLDTAKLNAGTAKVQQATALFLEAAQMINDMPK